MWCKPKSFQSWSACHQYDPYINIYRLHHLFLMVEESCELVHAQNIHLSSDSLCLGSDSPSLPLRLSWSYSMGISYQDNREQLYHFGCLLVSRRALSVQPTWQAWRLGYLNAQGVLVDCKALDRPQLLFLDNNCHNLQGNVKSSTSTNLKSQAKLPGQFRCLGLDLPRTFYQSSILADNPAQPCRLYNLDCTCTPRHNSTPSSVSSVRFSSEVV